MWQMWKWVEKKHPDVKKPPEGGFFTRAKTYGLLGAVGAAAGAADTAADAAGATSAAGAAGATGAGTGAGTSSFLPQAAKAAAAITVAKTRDLFILKC